MTCRTMQFILLQSVSCLPIWPRSAIKASEGNSILGGGEKSSTGGLSKAEGLGPEVENIMKETQECLDKLHVDLDEANAMENTLEYQAKTAEDQVVNLK